MCCGSFKVEGEKGKGWRKALTYKSSLSKLVKRRCKELRSQLDLSSFPSEVQQPEVHESEENPAKELAFDAERAERKAEEAVQRWRGQQPQDSSLLPTESPQQELAHQSAVNGGAPRVSLRRTASQTLEKRWLWHDMQMLTFCSKWRDCSSGAICFVADTRSHILCGSNSLYFRERSGCLKPQPISDALLQRINLLQSE